MVTNADPLDFANITNRVNCLVTAASKTAIKFISFNVKDLVLSDKKGLNEVPFSRLRVLSNLSPDQVRLGLAGELDVHVSLEVFTVLSGDDRGEEGC